VRYREDLAYDPIHLRLTELFPGYRYQTTTTREPDGERQHLQELLRDGTMERIAGFTLDPSNTRIYLCGNPGMIGPPRLLSGKRLYPESTGLVEILEERGLPGGYPISSIRSRATRARSCTWGGTSIS